MGLYTTSHNLRLITGLKLTTQRTVCYLSDQDLLLGLDLLLLPRGHLLQLRESEFHTRVCHLQSGRDKGERRRRRVGVVRRERSVSRLFIQKPKQLSGWAACFSHGNLDSPAFWPKAVTTNLVIENSLFRCSSKNERQVPVSTHQIITSCCWGERKTDHLCGFVVYQEPRMTLYRYV